MRVRPSEFAILVLCIKLAFPGTFVVQVGGRTTNRIVLPCRGIGCLGSVFNDIFDIQRITFGDTTDSGSKAKCLRAETQ